MYIIRNAAPNTLFEKNVKLGTLCSFKAMFTMRPKQYEKKFLAQKYFSISTLKTYSHNNLRKWKTSNKTVNQHLPKILGNRRWSITFVTATKTQFCCTILQEIFRRNDTEKLKESPVTEFNGVTNSVARSQFMGLKPSPRHTFNWVPNILHIGF